MNKKILIEWILNTLDYELPSKILNENVDTGICAYLKIDEFHFIFDYRIGNHNS